MEDKVTVNQPTNAPVAKVQAVGISGAITTVIVLLGGVFGITLPDNLADNITQLVAGVIALTTLINFVAGYLKKSRVRDI